jgi:hypothetical protein
MTHEAPSRDEMAAILSDPTSTRARLEAAKRKVRAPDVVGGVGDDGRGPRACSGGTGSGEGEAWMVVIKE